MFPSQIEWSENPKGQTGTVQFVRKIQLRELKFHEAKRVIKNRS
jgi:hypothetical protein